MLCLLCLICCLPLIPNSAGAIDFNNRTDELLVKISKIIRQYELNTARIPPGKIENNISFLRGNATGLDSLRRTGDCTKTAISNFTNDYDFHVGFQQLSASFDNVTLDGVQMAATVRPRGLSLQLRLTIDTRGDCKTQLRMFQVERLTDVELTSSSKEFDGADLDFLFQTEVRTFLNNCLRNLYPKIAQSIQIFVCGYDEGPVVLPPNIC